MANLSYLILANFSPAESAAVRGVIASGVFIAIAAGNNSTSTSIFDACGNTPASVPEAMTVAASEVDAIGDYRALYSAGGACVSTFAVGTVVTAKIGHAITLPAVQGTSYAAPAMAGLAARYLERHPTDSPSLVKYALRATGSANTFYTPAGWAALGDTPALIGFAAPDDSTLISPPPPRLWYQGHVQGTGWQPINYEGNTIGTTYMVSVLRRA